MTKILYILRGVNRLHVTQCQDRKRRPPTADYRELLSLVAQAVSEVSIDAFARVCPKPML